MRDGPTIGGKPVTMGKLRSFVFLRDRYCFAYIADRSHRCTDAYSTPHRPDDLNSLTLEHVTMVHGATDGRKDDERHCVALCHQLNGTSVASKDLREKMRDHLRKLYPECRVFP